MLEPPPGPRDHGIGPADAPVVLVEYGDYQCPHCARAYAVLRDLLPQLGDSVRYVFRNFPLRDIHPDAGPAAETAESVAAHGGETAFWELHAMLFENQDALDVDDLLGYADACGVDPEAVADDLASRAQRPRVDSDMRSGFRSAVNGTPTFFVNGQRFAGNWADRGAFADALEEAAHLPH